MSHEIVEILRKFFADLVKLEYDSVVHEDDSDSFRSTTNSNDSNAIITDILKALQNTTKLTEVIRINATKVYELGVELERIQHKQLWLEHVERKFIDLYYSHDSTPEQVTKLLEDTIVFSNNCIQVDKYSKTVYYIDIIEQFARHKPEWKEWEIAQRAKQPMFLEELDATVKANLPTRVLDDSPKGKKENLAMFGSSYNQSRIFEMNAANHDRINKLVAEWKYNCGVVPTYTKPYTPPSTYKEFIEWIQKELRDVVQLVCTCSTNKSSWGVYGEQYIKHALRMPQYVVACTIIDEFAEKAKHDLLEHMGQMRAELAKDKYIREGIAEWFSTADKSATIEKYGFLATPIVLNTQKRKGHALNFNIKVWHTEHDETTYTQLLTQERAACQRYIDALSALDGGEGLHIHVTNYATNKYYDHTEIINEFKKFVEAPADFTFSYHAILE